LSNGPRNAILIAFISLHVQAIYNLMAKSQMIGSCCRNILILHDPQFMLQHRKEREAHEKTRQNQHELEEKFEKLKSSEF